MWSEVSVPGCNTRLAPPLNAPHHPRRRRLLSPIAIPAITIVARANELVGFIENTATMAAYVKRCVVEPGAECCGEFGVRDTRAVRDAVMDFFLHGAPPADASPSTSATVAMT